MPITTLDPRTALIVIDLQRGLLRPEIAEPLMAAVGHTRQLADAFRARGLPVVWVNVAGGPPGRTEQPPRASAFPPEALELIPELGAQPGDLRVTKRTWGALIHTDLDRQLRDLGVTGVVVCGVSASIGVESTARQAFELGFNVTIPTDALADMNPDAMHNSLTRIFPRLAELGTSAEILTVLYRTHPQ